MDNKLDLWGNVEENGGSTNFVLSLIQEQASLLSSKTNGKVKADFSSIKYQYQESSMEHFTNILKSYNDLFPKSNYVEIDERKNLENASNLYKQEKFKFEIYSEKYKYRIFTLEYQSVFPIKLEVEYGILDNKAVTKDVYSIDELKSLLVSIFTSNKVRFIIQKMMES